MTISDLHTVHEDYDEEDDDLMNPAVFVHNQEEYASHVFQAVEYDTVLKEIKAHINKIKRVKEFLLMCVLRKRFQRKRQAQGLLTRYLKSYKIRKETMRILREKHERMRVIEMKKTILRATQVEQEQMH